MAKCKERQSKSFKRLSDFIRIHSTVKQLSNDVFVRIINIYSIKSGSIFEFISCRLFLDFSDIFQPIFMAIFTWSLMTICITMLMLQTEIVKRISYKSNFNFSDISFPLICRHLFSHMVITLQLSCLQRSSKHAMHSV